MVQNLVTNKHPTTLKKAFALALTVALLAMMVAPAFAVTETLSAQSALTGADLFPNYKFIEIFPTTSTNRSAYYQIVNITATGYLSRVVLILRRAGASEDGDISVRLYGTVSQAWNTKPNATIFAQSSTTINMQDITTSIGGASYDFLFNSTLTVTAGQYYALVVYCAASCTVASLDGACTYLDDVGNTYGGYYGAWFSNAWSTPATTADVPFELYVSDTINEPWGDLPEEPSGGTINDATTTNYDTIIANFVAFLVPLIVMFLPALLLCFITRRVDKWLILIGIAIGAGLGYYFEMVPLWVVFLVTIGLVGMAYQSVRGGD